MNETKSTFEINKIYQNFKFKTSVTPPSMRVYFCCYEHDDTFHFNITITKFFRLTENPWICSCKLLEWKQDITNKKRAGKIPQKCVTDLQRGEVHCTGTGDEYSYVFDNKLSPRCGQPEDMKDRSVYYALRKNTKCTMTGWTKPQNATSLVVRMKLKAMEDFVRKSIDPNGTATPAKKLRQDQFKAKYRKAIKNTIEYQMSRKEKRINEEIKNEI